MNNNGRRCKECGHVKDSRYFGKVKFETVVRYKKTCEACENKEFYAALKFMEVA